MKRKLSDWVARNRPAIIFTLSAAVPILSGLYMNVYTTIFLSSDDATLITTVHKSGWWNLLLFLVPVILTVQYAVSRAPEVAFEALRDHLVTRILRMACQSLIYPKKLGDTHIRAIVSLLDERTGRRVARYSFNADPDPERQADWPANFGVTGKAFTEKQVVIEELQDGHHATYTDDVKRAVLFDVKTVLAAPIIDPLNRRGTPLGVVAFDSVLPMKSLKFDTREIRHLAQGWADILAVLLTQHADQP